MATAPNIDNLTISKGVVKFTPTGGSETDLGECSNFTYTADVTKKDYFSNRSGIRTKVKSVVTQLSATIKLTLNEINDFNVALYTLAETGTATMEGLTDTQLTGVLTFTGANSVGTTLTFSGNVQMQPGGDFNLLQDNDDWTALPINAEVLANTDGIGYGHWTTTDEVTA